MKKSMQIRYAVLFSLFATCMLMTNDADAQIKSTKSFAEKTAAKLTTKFNFNVIAVPCFNGGIGFRVQIAQPEKYTYLWEINGGPGGHQMSIDCACGEYATVRVMRKSDGYKVFRTLKLSKCGDSSF